MRVPIDEITVAAGRRQLQPDKVRAIADSILEIGLINPITIGSDKVLIAGLHRLEACKLAGMTEIECAVLEYDELRRELAEIDENLMRADLTMLEQGLCLARRKEIYEGLHPETRQGGAPGKSGGGKVAKTDKLSGFASDASDKTGDSERTIRRRTSLGERLEMFADLIRGTPLEDNQSELQALAKLDDAEIVDVLETVRAGKAGNVQGALSKLRNLQTMSVMGSSESPEWYTPRKVVDLTLALFGEIDLDPCSNSHEAPNVPAKVLYTREDDGLSRTWHGRVYMNPPYGDEIGNWVEKLLGSYGREEIVEAIALLPGRIDTRWYQPLYNYLICHVRGRLQFVGAAGGAPFPSVIVYVGPRREEFMAIFSEMGPIMERVA